MKNKFLHLILILTLFCFSGFSMYGQSIAAGFNHSLFRCATGTPQSVGSNTGGELGMRGGLF